MNKNVVEKISHSEYKNILLHEECFRNLMIRIQSWNNRIETFEIRKISLSCFDGKINILRKSCDGLALGY